MCLANALKSETIPGCYFRSIYIPGPEMLFHDVLACEADVENCVEINELEYRRILLDFLLADIVLTQEVAIYKVGQPISQFSVI